MPAPRSTTFDVEPELIREAEAALAFAREHDVDVAGHDLLG
jgi:hypothetical protein